MSLDKFWLQSNNGKQIDLPNLKELKKSDLGNNNALIQLFNIFDTQKADGTAGSDGVLNKSELTSLFNTFNAASNSSKGASKSVFESNEAEEYLNTTKTTNGKTLSEIGVKATDLFEFLSKFAQNSNAPVNVNNVANDVHLTEEQAQEEVISTISEDTANARTLLMKQDNGHISKLYNEAKELFDSDLSLSNVEEAFMLQEECLENLSKAKEGKLSKREYFLQNREHLKTMMKRRLFRKDENTGLDFLDSNRGKMSKQEFAKLMEDYINEEINRIDRLDSLNKIQHSLLTMGASGVNNVLKKYQKAAQNKQITDFSVESKSAKLPSKTSAIPQKYNTTEPMTFKEVFEIERNQIYSKDRVEAYISQKQKTDFAVGAYNKYQSFKMNSSEILNDYTKSVAGTYTFGGGMAVGVQPNPEKQMQKVLEAFESYYANPIDQNSARNEIETLIKDNKLPVTVIQISDGKLSLDLSKLKTNAEKNNVLNKLLKLEDTKLEAKLKTTLGGEVDEMLEMFSTNTQFAFTNAYGHDFTNELVQEMSEDNKTVIQRCTGNASQIGMGLTVVGGVLCFTPLAGVGATMVGVGNTMAIGGMVAESALGFEEALSRSNLNPEEIKELSKTLVMNAGGFVVGYKAGQTGMKAFNKLIDKKLAEVFKTEMANGNRAEALKQVFSNPEYLKNFMQAAGVKLSADFMISYAGDLAMMGILDTNDDWKSLLQSNLIGIITSMGGDLKNVANLGIKGNKAKKHTKDVKNKNEVDLKFESTVTSIKTDNIKNKLFDYLEHKKTNTKKDYYKGFYDNMISTLKAMGDNFDYETFNAHSKEFLSNIDFLIKLDISPSNFIQEGWFSTENGIDAFNYFKRNLSTKKKKYNVRSDFDITISLFNPNNWQSALKRGFIDASKKFKVPDGVDIYEYVKKINELAEYSDKQLKLISEFKEKGISYCSENDDINRLFLECGNSKSKDLLKCIEDKIIKSANKDDTKIKSIVDNIIINKEQVSLETLSRFNNIEFATKHYKDIVELHTTISEGANAIEIKEDNNWGHYDDAVDVINNMAENSKLTALLIKLNKSNNFTAEEIYKISLSLNSNSVDFIKNLTSSTELSSSEIVDIIYKTRFVFIKTTELKQDIELYNFINSFNAKTKNICLKSGLDIDEKIKPLAERFNKKYDTVTVPKEKQHGFVSAFLSNNNPVYNNILKTFDFSKYQNGLPLKYRREDFRQNVEKFLKNLSEQEQNTLLSHFGLKRGSTGFDGIFNNKDFQSDSASPEMLKAAKNIQTEIENFTLHNEITTGNKEIDGLFTSLLQGCPEFATMVGKAQHANHAYSVDIHTLKVLQSAMNDPIYKTLSDADKTVLKLAVLFHDIGKGEGKNEAMHAYISSDYAIAILDKLNLPQDIKDKVVRIVDNHHWFADYNTGKISAIDVAVRCRKEGDFNIYKILAKADLANVNKYFHLNVTGTNNLVNFNAYMDKLMQRINDIRIDLNRTSSPVMASKIIKNGEFFEKKVVTTDDGENITVSVLNYNELPKNTDLSKYGFAAGTTTENATHIVHLTKGEAELETAITLTKNPKKDTNFSASLIRNYGFIKEGSEKRDVTYLGKFGVVFDAQQ